MDAPLQPAPLVNGSGRRGPRATSGKPRSLPIVEWPKSDRLGWEDACRPAQRLQRGGAASHLARVSQADIANRYGLYLDFLQRSGRLDLAMGALSFVTPDNVNEFIAELQARVRSVTVWNSVYKLRRAGQLIAPGGDFGWLAEVEKDIALVMIPRSKADRLVLTERLVEAGLVMIKEAETFGKTALARAVGVRNGLLIALLALHPIRIKNFSALAIADTFVNVDGRWWLYVPADDTKSNLVDQREVPEFMTEAVNKYLNVHRTAQWQFRTTRALDLLDHRPANDRQEPRHPDLETHARDNWSRRLSPSVPNRRRLYSRRPRWKISASRQRAARPPRPRRRRGTLQSRDQS